MQPADTVAQRRRRPAPGGGDRPVPGGEDQGLAPADDGGGGAGLGPHPVFDHQELAAGVVDARFVEADDDLEGEDQIAVQVAV